MTMLLNRIILRKQCSGDFFFLSFESESYKEQQIQNKNSMIDLKYNNNNNSPIKIFNIKITFHELHISFSSMGIII